MRGSFREEFFCLSSVCVIYYKAIVEIFRSIYNPLFVSFLKKKRKKKLTHC